MSNQEKIYKYILANPINDEFKLSDISEVASRILRDTTGPGKIYAVLKFIQVYCNAKLDGQAKTIERKGDPRVELKVDRLNQMRFAIRPNVSALRGKQIGKGDPVAKTSSVKVDNNKECPDTYKYDDQACCNKECFHRETQEFRKWLLDALHEFPGFVHKWKARGRMYNVGLLQVCQWSCTSLFSAYQQYVWPAKLTKYRKPEWTGRYFEETDACLAGLKKSLEVAINNNNGKQCRVKCREIFEWGGVDEDNRNAVAPHIKTEIPCDQLAGHLAYTRDLLKGLLSNGCGNSNINYSDKAGNVLRVDSGTTKLYSLICENFIMYDGRVASGLGYLVRKWWECKHVEEPYNNIPYCLRFSCDKTKNETTGIQYRNSNPEGGNGKRLTVFKSLGVNKRRVRENIQASWLLKKLLEEDGRMLAGRSSFSYIKDSQKRLRALESAIFMIGYSLQ